MITVVLRIQTKEYKSWFSFGKQLSPEGRSWLDQNDRTIISLWDIMVFQRFFGEPL